MGIWENEYMSEWVRADVGADLCVRPAIGFRIRSGMTFAGAY